MDQYRDLLRLDPVDAESHNNLGFALMQQGEPEAAAGSFERALALRSDYPDAHYNLARSLIGRGQSAGALVHLREALRLRADWVPVLTALAQLQASSARRDVRNPEEGLRYSSRAVELSERHDAAALDALAAAYAAAGRFDQARETAEEAAGVADGQSLLFAEIQAHLALYRAGRPLNVPDR